MLGGTSGDQPTIFSISSGNFAGFAVSTITAGESPSGSVACQSRKPRHATAPCGSSSNWYWSQNFLHRRARAFVGNGSGKQIAAHRGEVGLPVDFAGLVHLPAINRHQPGEIARMADVHRVGNRVARRRNFFITPLARNLGNASLSLTGAMIFFTGKPISPRDDRAHHVAEISAGNGKHHRLARLAPPATRRKNNKRSAAAAGRC